LNQQTSARLKSGHKGKKEGHFQILHKPGQGRHTHCLKRLGSCCSAAKCQRISDKKEDEGENTDQWDTSPSPIKATAAKSHRIEAALTHKDSQRLLLFSA